MKNNNTIEYSASSPNGKFLNLSETRVIKKGASYADLLLAYFRNPKNSKPSGILPTMKSNLKELNSDAPIIIWFGHSSYLIHYKGFNILVDPVLNGYASPVPGLVKAYRGTDIYKFSDFPTIDALVITHNHYDHLDKRSIRKLRKKIRTYYVPLGVGKSVKNCHVNNLRISEMDWWDSEILAPNIKLISTPARHMSGRGLVQNKSLWSSYVLLLGKYKIFIGGDSGYDTHFKNIGDKFGSFDIAILECGQYNENWPNIHMMPEETAQAAIDLNAKVLMPVHWGKFSLAHHSWNEPIIRLHQKNKQLNLEITTPLIGQRVIVGRTYPNHKWWE